MSLLRSDLDFLNEIANSDGQSQYVVFPNNFVMLFIIMMMMMMSIVMVFMI